jgi:3-deoxy-D-manno-octulosonic-acid transferase
MASPSLWVYRLLMLLVLPVALPVLWLKDRLTGKRRPPVGERLVPAPPRVGPGGVWIQAVSVGEVEVARRLLRELGERRPDLPLVVTATTATGLDLARRGLTGAARVLACPFDLPRPVGRLLEAVRPRLLVLVETELWPELMHQASRRGVAVAVVNGRLSDASFARYRRLGRMLGPLVEPLSLVLVRDPADGRRFGALGVPADRVRVAGNIKYDLEPDSTSLSWEGEVARLAGDRPVVVAGSTMEGEEELVLDAIAGLSETGVQPFVIVAPRHPERFESVGALLRRRGVRCVRRSELSYQQPRDVDVLLLDSIGELARAYRLGLAAFLGGSLVATGGHNPLEPAVWGIPVVSGPHVANFREVYDEMVAAGGARLAGGRAELTATLAGWLTDPDAAAAAGKAGRRVVESNRGATARTVDALLDLIDRSEE